MHRQIRLGLVAGFLASCLASAGNGQQQASLPEASAPNGSLSGTAYCADTNQPARLASIYLFQISKQSFGSQAYGQTDLEGHFLLKHLSEGDYYVVAVLPGYVNLLSSLTKPHFDAMTDEERKALLAQLPGTRISENQTAQISIRIERGAEIDGTVLYDDGSPAIGLRVSYKLKTQEPQANTASARLSAEMSYSQYGQPFTDDQGRFRILGIPPGEYLVHATVPTNSSQDMSSNHFADILEGPLNELNVYVGGVFRASKAETIEVDAGGASKDANITIPLSKLHTLRGQVVLKSTGQPPVTANVQLLYADTKEEARSVLAPEGKFAIFYVPEDNFELRAAAGAQAAPDPGIVDGSAPGPRHIIWTFPNADIGSPEIPLQVTRDVENITIAVPDPSNDKKGPSIEIFRGEGMAPMEDETQQ